ncbi:MAG TPA: indole-3-glycerol phosphate synthase TrpC [Puia sp.]|jgi:indole-3-glycerol phosphate synthase|nr:indole-3-glycerol phosphate synthase TrpC [Puia sp.]
MNILDSIIAHKRTEIAGRKAAVPLSALEKSSFFFRPSLSLKSALRDAGSTGIIAEFKRRSPSKGVINDKVEVAEVTRGYTAGGAACLSVLTDQRFFGGSNSDLVTARVNEIPILRKEFIVDEYQIVEARAIGADVILLIAACLTPAEVRRLAVFARGLGLEVLLEIHGEEELEHICDETALVGVNNRDLKTFTVDIERSIRLSRRIPVGKLLVAESGISNAETIVRMKGAGFKGFLIGESFMKEADPAAAFRQFVRELQECERHSMEK